MAQSLPWAVLAGAVSAGLYASIITQSLITMVLAYFTIVPLLLAGLVHGRAAALVAGLSGSTALAVLGDVALGITFAIVFAAPSVVLVRQALLNRAQPDGSLVWYPPGLLLLWVAGIAAVVFGGVVFYLAADADLAAGVLLHVRGALEAIDPASSAATDDATLLRLVRVVPVVMALSWMVMAVINGALAQYIAQRTGRNIRPGAGLSDVELPQSFGAAFAIGGLAAWLGDGVIGQLGLLVAGLAGLAFLIQGLSVVHALLRSRTWRGMGLAGFYLALLFLGQILVPAVALVGLVEPWLRLRERFGSLPGAPPAKED